MSKSDRITPLPVLVEYYYNAKVTFTVPAKGINVANFPTLAGSIPAGSHVVHWDPVTSMTVTQASGVAYLTFVSTPRQPTSVDWVEKERGLPPDIIPTGDGTLTITLSLTGGGTDPQVSDVFYSYTAQ